MWQARGQGSISFACAKEKLRCYTASANGGRGADEASEMKGSEQHHAGQRRR